MREDGKTYAYTLWEDPNTEGVVIDENYFNYKLKLDRVIGYSYFTSSDHCPYVFEERILHIFFRKSLFFRAKTSTHSEPNVYKLSNSDVCIEVNFVPYVRLSNRNLGSVCCF